jgi:hypothetical protein
MVNKKVDYKLMRILSSHEPIDIDDLINAVVPFFTDDATEVHGITLDIRESLWPLLVSKEVVLTTDRKLFLPDHSKGLCYKPDKKGKCSCCGTSLFHLSGGPVIGCAHCQGHQKIPS